MTDTVITDYRARLRRMWMYGDYRPMAARFAPAAETVCDAAGVGPGKVVLDLATGTGNVALAAARRAADVTGSDLSPQQLARARQRADADGIAVRWEEADAEEMPHPDRSFDVVLSAFGAMYAAHPENLVRQVRRVLRPGGVFAMASWTPEGYMGRMSETIRRYLPPPDGVHEPLEWGDPQIARGRLSSDFVDVGVQRSSIRWAFPSLAAAREVLATCSPPHVAVREMIGEDQAGAMLDAIDEITLQFADSRSDTGAFGLDAGYLLVVGRVPA